MHKIATLILLVFGISLSSCVTSLNPKKVMGVEPGGVVKTVGRSKIVSGDISGWTSTSDAWFGSSSDKIELMPLDQPIICGRDIGRIPIGHEVEILKVKRYSWNHSCLVLAKLKRNNSVYKVVINPNNVEQILGLDFSSR